MKVRKSFSKAENLDVNAKSLGPQAFSVVSYQVNDPFAKKLLGDTPIVGRSNAKYKGLIRVTDHYVKVYKVAKKEELPLNEVTYAEKISDSELAVPLVGYPITGQYTIERIKE